MSPRRTLIGMVALATTALAVMMEVHVTECRLATEPAATVPSCTAVRVIHPDHDRRVRRIDCVTGDTTVERGRP